MHEVYKQARNGKRSNKLINESIYWNDEMSNKLPPPTTYDDTRSSMKKNSGEGEDHRVSTFMERTRVSEE